MVETLPPKYEIRNLTFRYGETVALRDISLSIPANQIFVLLGPAGSGKSTLLRLLNRLIDMSGEGRIEAGEVLFNGQSLYTSDVNVAELRRRVGMVFAQPVPLPMSIQENITYGMKLAGIRDQARLQAAVESTLRKAALWDEVKDRLNSPGNALSGGQQQRLCLARTLALEPDVILLDEPTSGLDPISTLKVEEALQDLKQSITIVFAPSSVQQGARIADNAAFLLTSELIEVGTGDVIFTRPSQQKTEDYITGRFG
ncbi:MAG: phosphate ABC transporter ATP-binding protein [Ardenticatenales bacterium]|nr:phosphate ABC transporter ATP-binding protein [Ardenticatenales bacterium]